MPSWGFIGPFGLSRNPTVDPEDLCNMYPELIAEGGGTPTAKGSRYAYYKRPGIQKLRNLGSVGRAIWGGNGRLFVLVDNKVLEVNNLGSTVASYTVGNAAATQPGQIVFVPSGPGLSGPTSGALLVWDGSSGGPTGGAARKNVWYIDGSIPNPPAVISGAGVGSIDGYGVVLRPAGLYPTDPTPIDTIDGTQFNISQIYNAATYDALDFGIKTTSPDQLLNIYTPGSANGPNRNEMWLQGNRTTEVWYDTGGTTLDPFPFSRVPGAFIPQGTLSQNAGCALNGNIIWLGSDQSGIGCVYKSNGYSAVRISTHAIENLIRQCAPGDNANGNAIAYTYEENGHAFWCLQFQTSNVAGTATLVWDDTEGLWHRRAFNGTTLPCLGLYHAWEFGGHYLLDAAGNIYLQRLDAYFQDIGPSSTVPITCSRTTPVISAENRLLTHQQLEVIFGGPYSNAHTFNLKISNDGGNTFSSAIPRTTGPGGTTNSPDRAIWSPLGMARKRCYQLQNTDNLPLALLDGIAEWSDSNEKVGQA